MSTQRIVPEVNAGSMADIAFLLLIFFLVTASIENDTGFHRMLPAEESTTAVEIKARNLFEISINGDNQLMAEGDILPLSKLRSKVMDFLDNGGALKGQKGFCEYCGGKRSSVSSDNPEKAIVSLYTSRTSDYAFYVAVQNEIIGAYNTLRDREGERLFGTSYVELLSDYNKSETAATEKVGLKERIEILRRLFPLKLVEPEAINLN